MRPVGPIVPVSWPPWPGSMTMRPIFSPSARVKERSPLRVGFAAGAGPMLSARALSDSEGGIAAAADLGKAGSESREEGAFADSGNKPSEGARGASMRAVFGVEAGDAKVAGSEIEGPEAAVAGAAGLPVVLGFSLAAEFAAATAPAPSAGP